MRVMLRAALAALALWASPALAERPELIAPRGPTTDRTPTFEWTPSSGAASYTLSVATSPDLSGAQTFPGLGTTSYNLITVLSRAATYYWRIDALRSDFTLIAASYKGSFYLQHQTKYTLFVSSQPGLSPLSLQRVEITSSTYQLRDFEALRTGTTYYWRVQADDFLGGNSVTNQFDSSFLVAPPLSAPVLSSPAQDSLTTSLTPSFSWGSVPAALSYALEVSRRADFATLQVSSAGILGTSYASVAQDGLAAGRWFWRVRATDGTNAAVSPPGRFTIDRAPPPAPVLAYPPPGGGLASRLLAFRWSSVSDPSGVSYSLAVSKNPGAADPLSLAVSGISTTSWAAGPLDRAATYYWRVTAVDGVGNARASRAGSFYVAEGVTYALEVSTAEAMTPPLAVDHGGISSSTYALLDAEALPLDTTCYWRVRGDDVAGNGSVYSSTFSFLVQLALARPALIAPADASFVPTLTPVFSWGSVAGASSYRLEVATAPELGAPVLSSAGIVGTAYQAAAADGLEEGRPYYWRVRATDGVNEAKSSTATFRIEVVRVPLSGGRPETVAPAGLESDRTPAFLWTPTPGAASYRLSVSKNPDLSGGLTVAGLTTYYHLLAAPLDRAATYYWRVEALRQDSSVLASSFKTLFYLTHSSRYTVELDTAEVVASPLTLSKAELSTSAYQLAGYEALAGGATYYWRVRADDFLGSSPVVTSTFSFSVAPALATPGLVTPADGGLTASRTPLFGWTAVPGALSYALEVSRRADFASLQISSAGISGSSYASLAGDGLVSGRYYWRVRATDGTNTALSPAASFTIDLESPRAFLPLYPPSLGTVSDKTVTFRWSASTDPAGVSYSIAVATAPGLALPVFAQGGISTTAVTAPSLERGGTYFWLVTAVDSVGHERASRLQQFFLAAGMLYILEVDTTPVLATPLALGRSSVTVSSYTPTLAEALADETTFYWRVRAEDQAGNGSVASSTFSFLVELPLGTPSLLTPVDAAVIDILSPLFTWTAAKGAHFYNVEVSTDPAFSVLKLSSAQASAPFLPTPQDDLLADQTTYYWRVMATDEVATTTSAVSYFVTNAGGLAARPERPLLLHPLQKTADRTPTFAWTPSFGAASYRLSLSLDPSLSGAQVFAGLTTYYYTLTAPLSRDATWYWKVEALRPNATVLATSFRGSFYVVSGVTYAVEVDTTEAVAAPLSLSPAAISSSSYQLHAYEALASGATYFWRVRADGLLPGPSVLSSTFSFSVAPALASPVLAAPAQGSLTASLTPVFSWLAVPGALSYALEVSRRSDFDGLQISSAAITSLAYASGASDGLLPGRWYWRVRATDGSDSSVSPASNFAIDRSPPSAVELVYPPAGGSLSARSLAFRWSASTDPAGVSYALEVSKNPGASAPLAVAAVGLSTTSFAAGPLDRAATYYWRVLAQDGVGNARASRVASFYVSESVFYLLEVAGDPDITPPPAVSHPGLSSSTYALSDPESLAEGATYFWHVRADALAGGTVFSSTFSFKVSLGLAAPSLIAPADGSFPPTLTPLFQWAAVAGATSYRLEVGTAPELGAPVISSAAIAGLSYAATGADALEEGTLYYWRVRATDGLSETRSSTFTFRIELTPAPPAAQRPEGIAPAGVESDRTPAFVWTPTPGAASYRLSVSAAPDLSAPLTVSGLTTYYHQLSAPLDRATTYYWRVEALRQDSSVLAASFKTSFYLSHAARYTLELDTAAPVLPPLALSRPELPTSTYQLGAGESLAVGQVYYWRVRSDDLSGGAPVLSSTFSFLVSPPLAAPTLVSPGEGAVIASQAPVFSWTSVLGAAFYQLQVSRLADFSVLQISTTGIGGLSYASTTLDRLTSGRYYWRVKATDGVNTSASPASSFTIDLVAPSPFALLTPAPGSVISDRTPLFAWSASTDATQVTYALEVAGDPAFSSPLISQAGLTAPSATGSSLDRGTTYYWRVTATDSVGRQRQTPLSQFSLANSVLYTVEVDTSDPLAPPLSVNRSSITASRYLLSAGESLPLGFVYWWRVRCEDQVAPGSVLSSTFSFSIDILPPSTITDLRASTRPVAGEALLSWTAPGDDALSGTLNGSAFLLQYTTDTAWAQGGLWTPTGAIPAYVYTVTIATSGVTPGSLEQRVVSPLLGGATYFFRAWTRDRAGNYAGLSNGATVTLQAVAPAVSTPAFTNLLANGFTVNWASGTPAGGYNAPGVFYFASVSTEAVFTASVTVPQTQNPFAFFTTLSANTTYFARVSTLSAAGFVPLGSTATLAVPTPSPQIAEVGYASVTVSWIALPAVPSSATAEGYRLEASTSPDFSGELFLSSATDIAVSSLAITGLSGGTFYSFRVGTLNWNQVANYTVVGTTRTLGAECDPLASVSNGNWSSFSTWSFGRRPVLCTPVTIGAGHTVTVDYTGAVASTVTVNGALSFRTTADSRLRLSGGELSVESGGSLTMGTDATPVPLGVKAELLLSGGTLVTQRGLTIQDGGSFAARGGAVVPVIPAAADAPAGATSLPLSTGGGSGWAPGDLISIGKTGAAASDQTELRTLLTITGANPTLVTWAVPLSYSHYSTGSLVVANLSRSVLVRSADPAKPAYVRSLATNAGGFSVGNAEFAGLGLNSPSHFGVTWDGSGTRGVISSSTFHDGFIGLYLNGSSGGLVENSVFAHNLNAGAYLYGVSSGTLRANQAFSNASHGVFVSNASSRNELSGNMAYSNAGTGIFLTGSSSGNLLQNNRAFGNLTGGLGLASASGGNALAGNDAFDNASHGISASASGGNAFSGNRARGNTGSGLVLSGSSDNIIEGLRAEGNAAQGVSVTGGSGGVFLRGGTSGNAGYGLLLQGGASVSWQEGQLGFSSASLPSPDGAGALLIDPGTSGTAVLKSMRLASSPPQASFNKAGSGLLSYAQDYDTGTVRAQGDLTLAGQILALDYATRLYVSTAAPPRVIRGSSLTSIAVSTTSDQNSLTQTVSVTYRGSDNSWHVEGSVTGFLGTIPGGGGTASFPAVTPQFTLALTASGAQDGDRADFTLLAASQDAGKAKRLLFAPADPAFNSGRSRLLVAPGAGLTLRGIPGTPTLMDRLDAGSTYYTLLASGSFLAQNAVITNTDPGGVQLSGSGPVSLSSTTFDFMGIAGGTNAYITARALSSQTSFYFVTFNASRSTAGAAAYNFRVEAPDDALSWSIRGRSGPLWGPDHESDPDGRVNWKDRPPLGPFVSAAFVSSMTVSWSLLDADGYTVDASTAAGLGGAVSSTATAAGSSLKLSPQGLDANTTYFFRLGALWASVTTYLDTDLSSATLALPVLGAKVLEVHTSSVSVAWTPRPPAPSSATAEGYLLEASTRADFGLIAASSVTAEVSVGTLTVSGLLPGTTYFLRVGSLNWNGLPDFAVAGSTRMPGPPAALTDLAGAAASTQAVALTWTAPGSDGLSGLLLNSTFTVSYTTDAVFASTGTWDMSLTVSSGIYTVSLPTGPVNPGTRQGLLVAGLEPNTTAYFRAWTTNWRGLTSALSNGATAATLAVPVTGARLLTLYASSAALTWDALPAAPSTATAEGYRVQASTAADFDPLTSSSETYSLAATTLSVTGLLPGTSYYFRVGSLNWAGVADYSVAFSTVIAAPPGPVTDLAAAAVSSATLSLTWTAPSPGTGQAALVNGAFIVQRTTDPVFAAGSGWDPAGSVPAWVYTVEFATTGVAAGTTQSLLLSGLDANTTQFLRLWTRNAFGYTAGLSNGATAATLAPTPLGLAVPAVWVTSMTARWDALPRSPPALSSQTAEGYRLEVSSRADFTPLWASSATAAVEASTLSVGGLAGGVTYYFRVGSLNWAGLPGYSLTVSTLMPIQLGVALSTRTLTLPGLTNMNATLVISTGIVAVNTGNVVETYRLQAATVTAASPWRIAASTAVDQFTLWTVINSTQPAAGDFAADDVLSDSDADATGSAFSMGGQNGAAVPPGQARTLWFKLSTPAATSTGAPQDVQIRATPAASP